MTFSCFSFYWLQGRAKCYIWHSKKENRVKKWQKKNQTHRDIVLFSLLVQHQANKSGMSFLKIKHILEEMIVSIKSHQYVLELLEFSMSQAIEKFFFPFLPIRFSSQWHCEVGVKIWDHLKILSLTCSPLRFNFWLAWK